MPLPPRIIPVGRPRELGVRVQLAAGESLQSAISGWAWSLDVSREDMFTYFGLTPLHFMEVRTLGNHARPEVLENISIATGLSTKQLRGGLMSALDGKALRIDTDVQRSLHEISRKTPFARLAGTRYCPLCLDERPGLWRMDWKLHWTFVCTTHQVLLHDTCPTCHQPVVEMRLRNRDVFDPNRCRATLGSSEKHDYCSQPLSEHWGVERLERDSALLGAQQTINDRIASPSGALDLFGELRALIAAFRATNDTSLLSQLVDVDAGELEGLIDREEHPGASAPADAYAMAVMTAAAIRTLEMPEAERASVLRSTTFERPVRYAPAQPHHGPGSGRGILASYPGAIQYPNLRRAVLRAHDADLTIGQRILWGSAVSEAARQKYSEVIGNLDRKWLARTVPVDFWAPWTVRLGLGPATDAALGKGLRAALFYTDTWDSYDKSNGFRSARGIARALRPRMLGSETETTQILAALGELKLWLYDNPSPIDYYSRSVIPQNLILPESTWIDIAARLHLARGNGSRAACAKRYLFARLTGLAGAAYVPGSHVSAHDYTQFRMSMTADLQAELDRHATDVLRSIGAHGPVTWAPPMLTLDRGAPGRAIDDIDLRHMHFLLSRGERRQWMLAEELGRSPGHVLAAIDAFPPPNAPQLESEQIA